MRILVVGSGGREHALAWKLAQESEVICAPGNPGIAEDVELAPISATDQEGLVALAIHREVDLVVVGPEDPLIAGLADTLRAAGIVTYGPNAAAARLEGSKAFSKKMMSEADVPTAAFETFRDPAAAKDFAKRLFGEDRQVAIKASGNALGKGVVVAQTLEEALEAIQRMMVARELGEAGETIVIEERLMGREFSLLTIVGDSNFVSLPVAQDYKRAFDRDTGPNTGGMGAYSPCAWVSSDMVKEAEDKMVSPILAALKSQGNGFRGTLFTGVMVTDNRAYCLEYNVRFGDPETQTVMFRLGSGLSEALYAAAKGDMVSEPSVIDNSVVTVVIASGGYPGAYQKSLPITLPTVPANVKIFHAGTAHHNNELVTNGGRVLAVTASAASVEDAREQAYKVIGEVAIQGSFFRNDIASNRP